MATEKQAQKAAKLDLNWSDLFQKQNILLTDKTKQLSQFTIDFSEQKEHLKQQFVGLKEMAKQTDKSFIGAVEAQEKKQLKGLDNLEKRLLKAEKRVLADQLERITLLQNELFPGQSLQERKVNFAVFYEAFGPKLIEMLLEELQPLEQEFNVVVL